MAGGDSSATSATTMQLQRGIDPARDHIRGTGAGDRIEVVSYGDFLAPIASAFAA